MYQAIMTIVEKGHAEEVIDAALAAGSHGGTIMNGRGSGIHETARLFGLEVEPEKELVLILTGKDATPRIVQSIYDQLRLGEPGNGIVFVKDIERVRGLYEPKAAKGQDLP